MNKKAISQQIIIYILSLIVFSLVLIYGIKVVIQFREKSLQTDFLLFRKQFTSDVVTIYGTFDSTKREYNVPATKVCFFDKEYQNKNMSKICNEAYSEYDPVLCDAWKSETPNNIYINHPLAVNFEAEHINLSDGYLCSPVNRGKLPLTLEGRGDKVLISGPKLIYESEFDPDKIFTVSVDLGFGWNHISFPLVLENYSVKGALSSIDEKYERVVYQVFDCLPARDNCNDWAIDQYIYPYEDIDLLYADFNVDERLPLETVDHEKGYWVYMNESATLTFTGKLPQYVEIDLQLNDVSFVSPIALPVEDIFGPRTGAGCRFQFDDNVQIQGIWYALGDENMGSVCNPFSAAPKLLNPGQGYRVFVAET